MFHIFFFTDDILLVAKADAMYVTIIKGILDSFGKELGLQVSLTKFKVYRSTS